MIFLLSLKLWHVTDGSCLQAICHAGLITCLTFSNDSVFLATGSMDMSLKVWEAATGKLTQVSELKLFVSWFFLI